MRGWLLLASIVVALTGLPASAQAPPVTRLAGADRIATAAAVADAGWTQSDVVVVATAAEYPDALAATALAASADAPLLLTWRDELAPATEDAVRGLRPSEVVILGGEAAVGPRVAERLAEMPWRPSVRRVAGPDRFATATAAATDGRRQAGEVLIASGEVFADAVAAGALAALADHPPVLLTRRAALHREARGALTQLGASRATLAGGVAALAAAVADDVAQTGAEPVRLAGPDRYATSLALAREALARAGAASRPLIVASGAGFADALAAGALAARLSGVLVLVPRDRLPDETDAFLREHTARFDRAVVIGGHAAVGPHVAEELRAVLAGEPRPTVTITTSAGFWGTAGPLPQRVRDEMTGLSWRPGCPVGLDDLSLLRLRHRTFQGGTGEGELVVAARVAGDVLNAFAAAYDTGFPIARLNRVDAYGADDDASMADNNTSGFNCRRATDSTSWSLHAYGTAVDVNPVQNPYVRGDEVRPPSGRDYLNRGDERPGMLLGDDAVVAAFERLGWGWGGRWQTLRDYMHVSETGR